MKRNINNILNEYSTKHKRQRGRDISVSEVNAIITHANNDLYSAILYSFQYGYAIGHRHGQKEAKRKEAKQGKAEA